MKIFFFAVILTKETAVKSKQYKYMKKKKKMFFLPVSYGAKYLQWCNHFNDAYFINLVHHFLSLDYNVVKYQV